jgi:cytidylate kinase
MIVTMDGPAGAGKSSIARLLAKRLNYAFLDTGAMYRGVTLICLRLGISLDDETAVYKVAEDLNFDFVDEKVFINNEDITALIRTQDVTNSIRAIADNVRVRRRMVELQREWADLRNVVTEGRDQGTVAFPQAECKIFLTASPEERARRRVSQLAAQGISTSFEDVLEAQMQRDDEDIRRAEGGLKAASDAVYVYTDGLTEDQVIDKLVTIVRSKRGSTMVGT